MNWDNTRAHRLLCWMLGPTIYPSPTYQISTGRRRPTFREAWTGKLHDTSWLADAFRAGEAKERATHQSSDG